MRYVLLAGLIGLFAGCGRNGPEIVPAAGKITYGGGPWPRPGMLYFTPVQAVAGLPIRPAWAEFKTDGTFRVTSFTPGDGLVPGRYQVAVECWETAPVMGSKTRARSCIPLQYRSPATSGLEVSVLPGQRKISLGWDVPKQ